MSTRFEERSQVDMTRQLQFLTESPFLAPDTGFLVLTRRFVAVT